MGMSRPKGTLLLVTSRSAACAPGQIENALVERGSDLSVASPRFGQLNAAKRLAVPQREMPRETVKSRPVGPVLANRTGLRQSSNSYRSPGGRDSSTKDRGPRIRKDRIRQSDPTGIRIARVDRSPDNRGGTAASLI